MCFRFLEPGLMIDRELELVEPDSRFVADLLRSCAHPLCRDDPAAAGTTAQFLADFLRTSPRGRYGGDPDRQRVPAYHFWMRLGSDSPAPIPIAGHLGLRIGDSHDLEMYYGHIGYTVYPPARGRHYAERACRLLFPLARAHGMKTLWITCNPDNIASRRTCDRLGGEMTEIVDVPRSHPLYKRGEIQKCRYRVAL
jgi:tagatose 1,6-diphosphate aldolase